MLINSPIAGAGQAGSCYIVSNSTSVHLNRVGVASTSLKWAQMYMFKERAKTEHLVRAAESNGFQAIVVTVDVCNRIVTRRPGEITHIRTVFGSPMMEELGFKLVRRSMQKNNVWAIGLTEISVQ